MGGKKVREKADSAEMEIFWSTDVLWKQKLENYRIGNSEGAILEFRDFEATLFGDIELSLIKICQ